MRRGPPVNLRPEEYSIFLTEERTKGNKRALVTKVIFILIVHRECPGSDITITACSTRSFTAKRSREAAAGPPNLRLCLAVLCGSACVTAGYTGRVCWVSRVVSLCFSKQLLRTMGKGWASVLNTHSSSGSRLSSEKRRYRYLTKKK